MNIINIHGRLGKDVELTQSKDGKSIGKFSVGVTRKFNKEITDWFNCVSFGKQAETIAEYLKKGSEIVLSGEIQFGDYTDKEGIKRYTTTLVVNQFDFCGSAKNNDNGNTNNNSFEDGMMPIDDGDMPF